VDGHGHEGAEEREIGEGGGVGDEIGVFEGIGWTNRGAVGAEFEEDGGDAGEFGRGEFEGIGSRARRRVGEGERVVEFVG
jgi:hypothetical protein